MNDTVFVQQFVFVTGLVTYRICAFNSHGISDYIEFTVDILTDMNQDESFPNEFTLYNNYPNPFNATTKIKFSIPLSTDKHGNASLKTRLSVFDILGNEIAVLINESKTAGTYEIEFDGDGLPSGVYICNIQAGDYTDNIKMVLLK
jgi:hypothetical protein